MPDQRAYILGVPVDVVTAEDVLALARQCVSDRRYPAQVVTINVEYIVLAQGHPEFASVLHGATLATADSSGVLWALRRQGISMPRRVGGSDLIWEMSDQARRLGHRVFLLGGKPGVAESASSRLRAVYQGIRIVGTYAGSARAEEAASIVDLVRRSQADILFVAFGAPLQDIWLARNLKSTGVALGMGVGGSFDYLAGTARRAPTWMQERNLEWLWRLLLQPSRWRRMLALPRFVWLVLRDTSSAHSPTRREK